ncbi:hypothetical protein [Arthrobacter sp. ov118]|jgi:hypothetical protein|uniref:hypothetical protein n=1 Tax=Arthrobacter sp. ov118 TaxID=1761747 RepID=UPI000B87188F|nr:hypothetical protein [Arthrobacter sp. ov118]
MITPNRIVVGQKPNQGRRMVATIIAPKKSQRQVRASRFIFGGRFLYSSELLMPHDNAQKERTAMVV